MASYEEQKPEAQILLFGASLETWKRRLKKIRRGEASVPRTEENETENAPEAEKTAEQKAVSYTHLNRMCVRFRKKKTALWRKNMIAFIKGTVDSLSEGKMILESHGIGYELNIPASMFDAGIREGEELKIYTHMSVREDGMTLCGCLSREDLEIYRMLIGVSGIGPKAALAVLSTLTADNLRFAVLSEDVQALSLIHI